MPDSVVGSGVATAFDVPPTVRALAAIVVTDADLAALRAFNAIAADGQGGIAPPPQELADRIAAQFEGLANRIELALKMVPMRLPRPAIPAESARAAANPGFRARVFDAFGKVQLTP